MWGNWKVSCCNTVGLKIQSKDQQCCGKWKEGYKCVQSPGRRGPWLDGRCYTRSAHELQLLDNECPFLVHIKNCFIRNEGWERRGQSHVQSSIWCVMLMEFKVMSIPLDFHTSHYSYEQYILRNRVWYHPRQISEALTFIHNKWGWSMSEIL